MTEVPNDNWAPPFMWIVGIIMSVVTFVMGGFISHLYNRMDSLFESTRKATDDAKAHATKEDKPLWDEINDLNKILTQHRLEASKAHTEVLVHLARVPTKDELDKAIEKVISTRKGD